MTARWVLWLDEITADQWQTVGGKAANLGSMTRLAADLGSMTRAGFRVPPGFCVTTAAYRAFIADNDLEAEIEALAGGGTADPHALFDRPMEGSLERDILAACGQLLDALPEGSRFAVRSSATTEDLADASFAGQGETSLNVGLDEVLDRVRDCWASLWAARAVSYRSSMTSAPYLPEMAVVVQAMIPCDVGGVAFSADPLGGGGIIIEAVRGLAEAVVQGTGEITRYIVDRRDRTSRQEGADVLTPAQMELVVEAALALEAHFGGAQDVEWGVRDGELYLFQCRPVTTEADQFFTQVIPGDDYVWTGGYLNERFPQPVSPLGWSVVGGLTEGLAFRDPLRYLGYRHIDRLPITKLYRGHPYTNVAVFQILYKVFPDALVPDDAGRYFPSGDTDQRKQASYPCCLLDPRFIISMLAHFVREPSNWSPLHNHRHWARFAARLEPAMETLWRQVADAADLDELGAIVTAAQRWSRELLGIHRWSLMAADLAVPLLGRLVGCWVSRERQAELTARLLAGLPNKSLELDQALRRLAASADPEGADLEDFLARYGHRSFNLDIYYPTFADEPEQVLRLLEVAGEGPDPAVRAAEREAAEDEVRATVVARPVGRLKWLVLGQVLGLARQYVRLREDQRFAWQRILALTRRAFVRMGERWAADGVLAEAGDVFFATLEEIEDLARPAARGPDGGPAAGQTMAARRVTFEWLQREFELAPHLTYPAFLHGNRPLETVAGGEAGRWQGVPVSPGLVRGAVRVALTPGQFERIAPGDVLVTRSTDPGWTPIFGRLGGLIMEQGGQLSHGSVVAREYGLPAVVGIPHITEHLHDGDVVLLDGMSGTVALEGSPEPKLRET